MKATDTTVMNYETGAYVDENGKRKGTEKVPVDYVDTVCKLFGVRMEWLVRGDGPREVVALDAEVEGFRRMAAIVDEVRAPTRPPESPERTADKLQETLPDEGEGGANQEGAS